MGIANMSVLGVQVARARKVNISGRSILTGIHKTAVAGPVPVGALGLHGDEQADLSVHGGLEKAVYAYPVEHYEFWNNARQKAGLSEIDTLLQPGAMGEILTLHGVMEGDVWVGDVLRFPHCELRVTQPREPCFKFNAAMGFNQASKMMAQSGYCGFYLAVDTPGAITSGERFEIIAGPRQLSLPSRFQAKMFKHLR
jgi:MOSC domain-containing protein YiiM